MVGRLEHGCLSGRFSASFPGDHGVWVKLTVCKVIEISFSSLILYWVSIGFGKHISQAKGPVATLLQVSVAQQVLYELALTFAKLSVILFYSRIFGSASRHFRFALFGTAFAVLSWLAIYVCIVVFPCVPVRKVWDPFVPGHCMNFHNIELGGTISNVAIDLVILLLPLPMLWRLHTSRAKKISLVLAFALGYW